MTAVTIPEGVTTIGNEAFFRCEGLTTIDIPDGVTTIGRLAFAYCSALETATLPNSATNIGEGVFQYCNALSAPIYNTSHFAYLPVSYSGTYTIPEGITTIVGYAFENCTSLTAVSIPTGVTEIGRHAFYGCTALSSVSIPTGVTEIQDATFYRCTSLATVSIPDGVTTIDTSAFSHCTNLNTVTLPSSLTTLRVYTFSYTGLSSVVFDNCVPKLGLSPFWQSNSLRDIYYPAYAYTYYTTNEKTNVYTLHPQIKIDREWTTYCATASFDVPEGIDAYVVKSYEGGVVTLKKVTTINEGEGLLMKPAEVGTFYDATLCAEVPAAYDSNLLKGVTEATAITATDGEYTNFIFTNGSKGLGFYPTNSGTIPAYKAYLQIPTASLSASAARDGLSIAFENDETAVRTVSVADCQDSDAWYTLGGQRTAKPTQHGIYIHQGKKVNIK